MKKHIYFVRHGESDSNVDRILRGSDSVLTEKGHQEATVLAERMKRIGVDSIVASSYIRAVETATPIADALNLPIETSDLFIERRSPSSFKGRDSREEVFGLEVEEFKLNFPKEGYAHTDAETFPQIKERALDALRFLEAHPAERICVVTHGIFLFALFSAIFAGEDFTGEDFRNTWRLEVSNTGITYAQFTEQGTDRWKIVSWNDIAHLG